MIYYLVETIRSTAFGSQWFGALSVFQYVEFRAGLAMLLSFALVMLSGKRVIRWLLKQKIGDNPEFYNKDLNQLMRQKKNTPTMGGVLIAGSILLSTLLLADLSSFYVVLGLVCLVWMHVVGLADDWLKLTSARRKPGSREGLYTWEKLLFQVGLAVILGLFAYHWGLNKTTFPDPDVREMTHSLTLPFFKTWIKVGEPATYVPSDYFIALGRWPFVFIAIFIITGFSNAVNLTDGMDGLASGVTVIVALAMLVLCIIAGYVFEQTGFVMAKYLLVPHIPRSEELAIIAAAMAGACLGFLWFNTSPAQVFMGDSGSLPLGALLGYIAIIIRQEFLLVLIGGVFAMEALSVILQVGYFKLTGGKRIFKCAPIHHHFHLLGWTEQQVVVRAWIVTAVLTALALATLRVR